LVTKYLTKHEHIGSGNTLTFLTLWQFILCLVRCWIDYRKLRKNWDWSYIKYICIVILDIGQHDKRGLCNDWVSNIERGEWIRDTRRLDLLQTQRAKHRLK